jgi:phosphatidylserine decarboxylase
MLNIIFPPLHKEGKKILTITLIINFFVFFFSNKLGITIFFLNVWIFYFFRDPERVSIGDNSYLVSPADGKICMITECNGPKEIGMDNKNYKRVSVFMNVFDCHVNRVPAECEVNEIFYKPGKFLNASLDKASEQNERNILKIKLKNNDELAIVQIAGLVARRIVSEIEPGTELKQGGRFGIIRFGSRVDIYFDNTYEILAKLGQSVVAGESLLAKKISS